jgi:hypothetical protein
LVFACGLAFAGGANAVSLGDLLKNVERAGQPGIPAGSLPQSEVASGLKQMLSKGTADAVKTLGRKNGFWDDPSVRIPLPWRLQTVADMARKVGMGDRVDAFQLSMNRAAEKAVPQVADIFGDAISKMTLSDAKGILAGGDHAVTEYFRRKAGPELAERIKPIVSRKTSSVGVTRKYKELMASGRGRQLGGALSMLRGKKDSGNALDLDDYVTKEAINGLFHEIGKEEKAIRENPTARTTSLLKRVFGGG